MFFRNIFVSLFLVFVLGFALVQAESKEPRGPKITTKVSIMNTLSGHIFCLLILLSAIANRV